jgi:hypothetical protein
LPLNRTDGSSATTSHKYLAKVSCIMLACDCISVKTRSGLMFGFYKATYSMPLTSCTKAKLNSVLRQALRSCSLTLQSILRLGTLPKSSKLECPWKFRRSNETSPSFNAIAHTMVLCSHVRLDINPRSFLRPINTKDSTSTHLLSTQLFLPQFPHRLTRNPMTNSQPILATPVTRILD